MAVMPIVTCKAVAMPQSDMRQKTFWLHCSTLDLQLKRGGHSCNSPCTLLNDMTQRRGLALLVSLILQKVSPKTWKKRLQ